MASTSGSRGRLLLRQPESADLLEITVDSEIVPSSIAVIKPFLRVANQIEEDNPRVAYLCRLYALNKAGQVDPSGRGVPQFTASLRNKLEVEGEYTELLTIRSDARELQRYFEKLYEQHILEGELKKKPEEMAKIIRICAVLYEVVKAFIPQQSIEEKVKLYATEVEKKRALYESYNIIPNFAPGLEPAIMEVSEVKAAISALCNVDDLPMPSIRSRPDAISDILKHVNDILGWLSSIFGFQKGNVANQREHLALLLANIDMRNKIAKSPELHENTVPQLKAKIFSNYNSWCDYVHCKSNLKFTKDCDRQQLELIYIALYLLIWGEASNIRFMPECICYIFHHMCNDVHGILQSKVHPVTGDTIQTATADEELFLREVITPIYGVLAKESKRNNGKACNSRWRNYDDLNEYFWSDQCFRLGWPMNPKEDFFCHSDGIQPADQGPNQAGSGARRKKNKINFVEVRTFWHLYRSFDRMWTFFILSLQAMIIIAWNCSGPFSVFFDEDVFRSVLSIFITYAFLNFLQVTLDIILTWNAWKSMKFTQLLCYFLKFIVAAAWLVVLPVSYSNWAGDRRRNQSIYCYLVAMYLLPNMVAAILFFFPPLRKKLEHSNSQIIVHLMWWFQPKLYLGRDIHEDVLSLMKYTMFWIMLLMGKLAFSYYVEISPLVGPTKSIMNMAVVNYEWHEVFPRKEIHNITIAFTMWAPIILVYFMDTQIWYAIFSTLLGGIVGAFSHLGEISTLGMLYSRLKYIPSAFSSRLLPERNKGKQTEDLDEQTTMRRNFAYFSHVWNEFIKTMREEDLISNRDKDQLVIPFGSCDASGIQWPLVFLFGKIPRALELAQYFNDDAHLFKKIKSDELMYSTIVECYKTLRDIIYKLLQDREDVQLCGLVFAEVEESIKEHRFVREIRMRDDKVESLKTQIIIVLQDILETMILDVLIYGHSLLENATIEDSKVQQLFTCIDTDFTRDPSWMEKVIRLHSLLTGKENAGNVPNLEARRRITFFANSLFMNMPKAPNVRDMLSFSVLTSYCKEVVLYSDEELNTEIENGISILFYLKKIYPDEWTNFEERIEPTKDYHVTDEVDLIRQWASCRGHTLYRTVRGMMYYRRALSLQCFLEYAGDKAIYLEHEKALADLKFTCIVSCQMYGSLKKSKNIQDKNCYHNILNLMSTYSTLRVAYIDEQEKMIGGKSQKVYYSVLVKGEDKYDVEIYRIKLPGSPCQIGEVHSENKNQAIIFTRGEALQTIDMNQENYFEEAFKMRNVLEEFKKTHTGQQRPTILGLREHTFTGSVSLIAGFRSNQEATLVTIGQRILANPLRVRFHYGHPDIFDTIFHITRGGTSKGSKVINFSEEIFAGFNSVLRGGFVTHHEYIQVGKGHDATMNRITLMEAKVAIGNGEQALSRDVYRLGQWFDFYRMLSLYFTTVGFYFCSLVNVLIVYMFLYGRLYVVLSGVQREILQRTNMHQRKAIEQALAIQSVFQMGLVTLLPILMEICLEKGFHIARGDFIVIKLLLASVFFTFQIGTRAHYYARTIMHGIPKLYKGTDLGFFVLRAKFAENYRMYSRSHFVKGLEILTLLITCEVYGPSYHSSVVSFCITLSMWFLAISWLFAPFLFNPSGFDWQNTVDDWVEWKKWMGNSGGIGIQPNMSWESWWDIEIEYLRYSDIRGKIFEILSSCRFFLYQYGIFYHLDIARPRKSFLVFGLPWAILVFALIVRKLASMGRRKFGTEFHLVIRILKALLFLGFISVMTASFVLCWLTISDLFACILAFVPSGWAVILIAQACIGFSKRIGAWDLVKDLAKAYEYMMGLIIFMPIAILSLFPFVSDIHTRLLFNHAFSRGISISTILPKTKNI